VVPLVLEMLPVSSVVDFGCGRGTWLKACLENGVETVLGLDGDYVKTESLLLDQEQFRAVDLREPIRLDRQFDLAFCLEVAEHLPQRSARSLVQSLAASRAVLFSAALPGQGGISHLNEQWPPYWEHLFASQGMRKYDVVRPLIWNNRFVELFYRHNLYLYVHETISALDAMKQFEPEMFLVSENVMSKLTFGWSTRALKYVPTLQRIHSCLSRFTAPR
jgi:SAM-dependent methyltransferase